MNSEDLIKYYGTDDIEISSKDLFLFELNEDNLTANIKLSETVDKSTLTQVVIPYECEIDDGTYLITKIDIEAFAYCNKLDNVIIPSSIIIIDVCAFDSCSNLMNVIIPNSVEIIEKYAFFYCEKLTNVNLSSNLLLIGEEAFRGCYALLDIIIPDTVTSIGGRAFSECYNLKSVTLSNNIEYISYEMFFYCENLTEIIIPSSVKSIKRQAFYCCNNLTNVYISEDVTTIGYEAFGYCKAIEKIFIPKTVQSIEEYAFVDCSNITIYFSGSLEEWNEINIEKGNESLEIANKYYYVNKCGENLLCLFDGVDSLIISGTGDMYNWENEVDIPWYDYKDLIKKVITEEGVTSIGNCAFYNCINLINITISDSMKLIGVSAFNYCISLTNIIIPNSVTVIGSNIFCDCMKLENVVLSNNIEIIPSFAFAGTGLKNIIIPNSVKEIASFAFTSCNLEGVIVPDSVVNLGSSAFKDCSKLKWIKLSNNLDKLSGNLFYQCTSLEVIAIPKNVMLIGAQCFMYCSNLVKVIVESEDLEFEEEIDVFPITNTDFKIFVNPSGSFKENVSFKDYIVTWSKYDGLYYYSSDEVCRLIYYDYNIIGGSILLFISDIKNNGLKKEIDSNAFLGCTELKMVEINENITVKSGTFENCVNLTDVFINTSSVTLENQVFPVNNPNFTIYVDSRSDLVQYEELQPYLYLLKTKKTLYNEQLFIAGVGEVELFNNNDIVLTSKTLIDTSINLTVNLEDIQANGGAKLYGKYASQAGMSLKLTEAMFRMEFLAANIGSEIEIGGSAVTSEMAIVENGVVKIDGTPLPLYLGSDKIFVWINAQGDNRGSLVFSNENIQEGENTDYGKTIINGVDLPNGTQVCVKYFESYEAGQTIKVSSNYLPDEMTAVLTAPLFAGDQNNLESAMKVGVLTITIPRLMLNGNSDISMNMTGYSQMNIEGQALAVEESECDEGGYYAIISKVIKNGSWTSNLAGIAIDNANHLKKGDILQVFGVFYGVGTRPLTKERYFVLPSNTIDERGIVTYSSDKDLLFTIILKDDNSKFTHGIVEGS